MTTLRLKNCYRTSEFRKLAKQRLPSPIFHYIDGGSDDEVTLARNTAAFDTVDLVPNVLAGIGEVDMSVSVLGQTAGHALVVFADCDATPVSP